MAQINEFLRPLDRFIHAETTAGILLFGSAITALIWANSPWAESYHHLWEHHLAMSIGEHSIDKSLHHWINDGLMAMFFFVVGLELKREIMAGELSNVRKALMPLMAAVGGMVVPALIYFAFNKGEPGVHGWGIPMATDIAFALGILALLGKRVPVSLKVFLTALAIADDLGAVLVIAFFYTSEISFTNLGTGIVLMGVLVAANQLGVRQTLFYGIIGIGGVWLAFLMSGVHATIAGVLAAMAIPARTKIDEQKFLESLESWVQRFKHIPPNDVTLLEPAQYEAVEKINRLTLEAATPLQRLERNLHPWVAFIVMPLFAFANAGITLSGNDSGAGFFGSITLGIIGGLIIGKVVGVVGVTWVLTRLRLVELPADLGWGHIVAMGFLAGIGFTMSLFITNLAFTDAEMVMQAKIGIIIASLLAGLFGYLLLRRTLKRHAHLDMHPEEALKDQSSTLGTRK
jgi:Na+:H+ antiporter, NhaA family